MALTRYQRRMVNYVKANKQCYAHWVARHFTAQAQIDAVTFSFCHNMV